MNYKTLTTPSGYQVKVQEYIKYGQKRKLYKKLFEGSTVKVSQDNPDLSDFEANRMFDMQDEGVNLIVVSITIEGVEHTEHLKDTIDEWREQDAVVVYDYVKELFAGEDPKKGGSENGND